MKVECSFCGDLVDEVEYEETGGYCYKCYELMERKQEWRNLFEDEIY